MWESWTKWDWGRTFSKYCCVSLSVAVHQYYTLIHSSPTLCNLSNWHYHWITHFRGGNVTAFISGRLQQTAHVHRMEESQIATKLCSMKDRIEGYCHIDWLWWEADETDLGSYPVVSLGIRSSEPFSCMTSESIHPCICIWDIIVAKSFIYCLIHTHGHFTWSCTAIISSTTRHVNSCCIWYNLTSPCPLPSNYNICIYMSYCTTQYHTTMKSLQMTNRFYEYNMCHALPTPTTVKETTVKMYFYSKTNQMNNISNLSYFGTTLYMFWTVFPSIIRSLRLYIQHQVHVIQVLWLLASKQPQNLYGVMLYVQS